MVSLLRLAALAAALSLAAGPASAYIGPGAGLSVIAAFWALITAVASSVLFLVLWPLRNRLRRRKTDRGETKRGIRALERPQPKLVRSGTQDRRR